MTRPRQATREVRMEALDATGSFWFPGSEQAAVYGSLVFDPADGTTLTLADGLSELLPDGERREAWGGERDRIYGQIDHDGHRLKVTLIDSIWLSPTKYHADRLLVGATSRQTTPTSIRRSSACATYPPGWRRKR